MIDHEPPDRTRYRLRSPPLNRWRRLSRRLLLPLTLIALCAALAVTGYSRFGGSPASREQPFDWDGSTAYIAGGHKPGAYTTCVVAPDDGARRVIEIPGSSGGLALEPWFDGDAELTCRRSVLVTTGMPAILYPYASAQPLLVGLAALAVLAWWCGRAPRGRLWLRNPFCR